MVDALSIYDVLSSQLALLLVARPTPPPRKDLTNGPAA
jgi:hypothetical protein